MHCPIKTSKYIFGRSSYFQMDARFDRSRRLSSEAGEIIGHASLATKRSDILQASQAVIYVVPYTGCNLNIDPIAIHYRVQNTQRVERDFGVRCSGERSALFIGTGWGRFGTCEYTTDTSGIVVAIEVTKSRDYGRCMGMQHRPVFRANTDRFISFRGNWAENREGYRN